MFFGLVFGVGVGIGSGLRILCCSSSIVSEFTSLFCLAEVAMKD